MASGVSAVLNQSFGGVFGAVAGLTFLFIFFLTLGIIFIFVNDTKTYRYKVVVFANSKSGLTQRIVKGGMVKRNKANGFEFRIKKPKRIINNFNREWVVMPTTKGKPTIFAFEQSDVDWIQLNPATLNEKGEELIFQTRELGKEIFAEKFRQNTRLQYGLDDWFMNNKEKLIYGGLVMIQMIMVLLLINVSNKVL